MQGATARGPWSEPGAKLRIVILPAWYQTLWFRSLCTGAFVLVLWLAYMLRLNQLQNQFQEVLEARVDERSRIAREIHDTLLQSFNGLLLRFQAVSNLLPSGPEEAKRRIESAIEQASEAITEGRDAVHELLYGAATSVSLDQAISNFGKELLGTPGAESGPQLSVQVEGPPKSLDPIVRDEVYRIGIEALRNAIRHASARRVEVEIQYGEEHFRLLIRDQGQRSGN